MEPTVIPITDLKSRDPIVAIVYHRDVTVDDLWAYREEHGASLAEAVRALGWKGTRFVRASEVGYAES
jgi:hypothetical protein